MSRHASNDGLARIIDTLFKSMKVKTIPSTKRWFNNTLDKLAKFDYSTLVPEVRISEKYPHFRVFSAEPTLRYCGPGLGVAMGKRDIWIGWPPERI